MSRQSHEKNKSQTATMFGARGEGGPAGALVRPSQKATDFKGTLKRLLQYLRSYILKVIIVLVFAVASTVFTIVAPKIVGKGMNRLSDGIIARMMINQVATIQKQVKQQIITQNATSLSQNVSGTAKDVNSQTTAAIKEFLSLPEIDMVTSAEQKAAICQNLISLSKYMPSNAQFVSKGIKFTSSQVDSAINAIKETNGKVDYKYISIIVFILIAVYVLSSLFQLVMQLIMSSVAQITVYQMRKDVNEKLDKLPLKYFDTRTHGEVLSRVTNDIDTISSTLQQGLTQFITSIIAICGYIVMMFTISWMLTLIVLCTLPLYIGTTVLIARISQKHFAAQQEELGELSGHVEEMYSGHNIVKAFGREEKSIKKFSQINERLYSAGWKAQFVSGIIFPIMNFISNVGYVAICMIGGVWMTKNMLNLGDITAFIQYSKSFTMPIIQTANIANIIQSTIACAERVFEILDMQEEISEQPNAKSILSPKGEVKFENVSFRYNPDMPLI